MITKYLAVVFTGGAYSFFWGISLASQVNDLAGRKVYDVRRLKFVIISLFCCHAIFFLCFFGGHIGFFPLPDVSGYHAFFLAPAIVLTILFLSLLISVSRSVSSIEGSRVFFWKDLLVVVMTFCISLSLPYLQYKIDSLYSVR